MWWHHSAGALLLISAVAFPLACEDPEPDAERAAHRAPAADRGTAGDAVPPSQRADPAMVEEVMELLESCPEWQKFAPSARTNQEILATFAKIRVYPLGAIRTAIAEIQEQLLGDLTGGWRREGRWRRQDTLYLLNKYLFDLPERYPGKGGQFLGGYMLPDDFRDPDREYVDLRYPFAVRADGSLALVGGYRAYSGPPYNALGVFDWYREEFGPREFQQAEGDAAAREFREFR